jgi:RNA 3'-phosphate cyclase
MIAIDGSIGEGGGQVLRSALTLSVITAQPVRITNIRARRPKPGLMAQHLKAVEAAAAVGNAQVEGAHLGSRTLVFQPRGVRCGAFHFDIGTAGSSSLVLQTVVVPLGAAHAASSVTVTGGTHVRWSPCFEYLQLNWLPYVRRIGFHIDLSLDLAGFFPQGGGRVRAAVRPASTLAPLRLTERGGLKRIRGISAVANLDMHVAERQRRQALGRLEGRYPDTDIELINMPSRFKGTLLLLVAEFEKSQCCYYGLGERGKPAERVADEAVDALEEFLATDGAVDQYLADQLLVPLSCAPGVSEVRTSKVTQHLITNAEIIRMFAPLGVSIDGSVGQPGSVRIEGGPIGAAARPLG